MPTTYMACITDGAGFGRYCLTAKKDKQHGANEPNDERVLFADGNFIAEPKVENLQDIRNQLALYKGKKYDAIALRIAMNPKDKKLNNEEISNFVAYIMKEYLPNRNYFFVVHGDSQCRNLHIHIIATFLDSNGNFKNFAGYNNSEKEAIARQEIIDRISLKYGLSVLERPAGTYRKKEPDDADTRQTIAMRQRLKDTETTLWLDTLRKDFKDAIRTEKTADAVFQRLSERGWTVSRETEKHITLSNGIYKCRLARLNKATPNRQALQQVLDRRNQPTEKKPILTPNPAQKTPCAQFGASSGGGNGGGNVVADEHDSEDVKQAINIYNKEQAKMASMAGQVQQVETEIDDIMIEDMLETGKIISNRRNRR